MMNLNTYLERTGRGAARTLARRLGVSPVLVSQWRTGRRPVPAGRCPAIEMATGGRVRCEVLRPDVDWAFLRGDRLADFQEVKDERAAA